MLLPMKRTADFAAPLPRDRDEDESDATESTPLAGPRAPFALLAPPDESDATESA